MCALAGDQVVPSLHLSTSAAVPSRPAMISIVTSSCAVSRLFWRVGAQAAVSVKVGSESERVEKCFACVTPFLLVGTSRELGFTGSVTW